MTAFSEAFRSEVMRMARKEIKGELDHLRKITSSQRSEIAGLKRELRGMMSMIKQLQKRLPEEPVKAVTEPKGEGGIGARLKAKREFYGVSQRAMGALLEASALSVSRWEHGDATPRAAQLARIESVLKVGKRAALARLRELGLE